MRRIAAMLGAAAMMLLVSSTVSAQAKPDFSGKWTMEAPAAGAAGGGGGGGGGGRQGGGGGGGFNCGMTCTITVTGNTLKLERMQGEQAVTNTFTLDGSDSKNPGRGGADVITKAKWEGNTIVFSTTSTGQDGTPVTATQTISLVGGKLTVVRNSGRAGATPTTQTYTKG